MQSEDLGERGSHKYLSFHRFLSSFGIESYKLNPLPADCSLRRYYRVTSDLGNHILMDSSEDPSIGSFVYIASILEDVGLRPPKIFKSDLKSGYLLIEDFGNTLLSQGLAAAPQHESSYYELCVHALTKVANLETTSFQVPKYCPSTLNSELDMFSNWYVKYNVNPDIYESARQELEEIFNALYEHLAELPHVLTLRDFMADNLMMLEGKLGFASLGILDFQSAVIGNCTYDLVSLLEDARRDVSPDVVAKCKASFCANMKLDPKAFDDSYTILGLQRNLKIIGIFHKRHIKDSESRYLDYLPRVWQFIEAGLEKDIAYPLKQWFDKHGLFIK